MLLAAHDGHGHKPAGKLQCRGNGLLQPRGDALLHKQTVHNNLDGVILPLVQRRKIVQRIQFAVNPHAHVAVLRQFFQLFAIRAFSPANNRRQNHDAVIDLADFSLQNRLHDLLARLSRNRLPASRAMRHAHRGVDHAQIVVNLCDRPHRRPRRTRGGFLLNRNRRRKPFNHVHFRAFHLVEKLSRVRGERLHVAALPFRVNGVKGERRFSRAGEPGDDRQGVPGNFDADVFQVVLPRAPDYQFGQAHKSPLS